MPPPHESPPEHPLLLSASMVDAVRRGEKTVTRRVMSRQPTEALPVAALRCPYGAAGHRLWVRETFILGSVPLDWTGGPASLRLGPGPLASWPSRRYAAAYVDDPTPSDVTFSSIRRTPGIHMPRWASRLLLEVVSVSVVRLHDLDEEEARREGVFSVAAFRGLWDALNGKRGATWESNPFVWRVEFRRLP